MMDEMLFEQRTITEESKINKRSLYPKNYEYDPQTSVYVRKIKDPELLKTA